MSRTYRAPVFACFYYGVILCMSVIWFGFVENALDMHRIWGTLVLILFGVMGAPFLWAKVKIDEHGITQHIYRRHHFNWEDIYSWERTQDVGSDGPETITLKTNQGPFALNHNCIYGKRLDEVMAELRNRLNQAEGKLDLARLYENGRKLFVLGKHERALDTFKRIYEVDIFYRDITEIVDDYYTLPKDQWVAKYTPRFNAPGR